MSISNKMCKIMILRELILENFSALHHHSTGYQVCHAYDGLNSWTVTMRTLTSRENVCIAYEGSGATPSQAYEDIFRKTAIELGKRGS
ncbi:hypothetical protein QM012_007775 [Aureobasidium pullulans]|uniref:Uncharacterized protein n=1 Tax=Aureobasidium pullulans TaxID=5580 RepID=A0ABR0TKM1_AURPU